MQVDKIKQFQLLDLILLSALALKICNLGCGQTFWQKVLNIKKLILICIVHKFQGKMQVKI
jgi:hypothetical protein